MITLTITKNAMTDTWELHLYTTKLSKYMEAIEYVKTFLLVEIGKSIKDLHTMESNNLYTLEASLDFTELIKVKKELKINFGESESMFTLKMIQYTVQENSSPNKN